MDTRSHQTGRFIAEPRRWRPIRRLGAVALVTLRQGIRLRLWILAPLALAVAIVSDLSSPRFDPVFDAIPAAVGTSLLVMTVLAVVVGIFIATYPTPAEMDAKVSYTLLTKPVHRWEVVAGKVAGLSLLLLVMLAVAGGGAYVYILVRAGAVQETAAERLREARPRAALPADLNPLEVVARHGPLQTYRYRRADAGPDFRVLFAGDRPDAPGTVWVVGQSGMRLHWNLTGTPLAEWAASGPTRIRLHLRTHRSEGAGEEPVEADIRLLSPRPEAAGPAPSPESAEHRVQRVQVPVPDSGVLEVPVVSSRREPPEGSFQAPEDGEVLLDVLAVGPKHLVGAGEGTLHLVGPDGRTLAPEGPPERRAARMTGRRMLVGRPEPPRPMAVFRFAEVPPGLLGAGQTPVEIAFTLDAYSPATVQSAAEATFVNPGTGQSRSFRFTPEGHHPTLLYLDRGFWHGGPLEVRLQCLTADDYMGLVAESVRLRLGADPFAVHFAKGVFCVLLFGMVLISAAVFVSARVSWFVSILTMIMLFAVGTAGQTLSGYSTVGWLAGRAVRWIGSLPGGEWLLGHVQLQGLLPGDTFARGEVMPWWEMGALTALVAAVVAVFVAAGAYLLRNREVAA